MSGLWASMRACLGCFYCVADMGRSMSADDLGTALLQVRGNADYIVDGLCRQLRHLENHPRCGLTIAAS